MNFFAKIRLKNIIICCDLHLFTATAAKESKRAMFLGEGEPRMSNPSSLKLWYTMMTNKNVGF